MFKKYLAFVTIFIVLSGFVVPVTIAGTNSEWHVKVGDIIKWSVVVAPNTTFWWWDNDTGTPRLYLVLVQKGDIMEYNITSVEGSALRGNFKLGNLTVTGVTPETIGMNLVFGLWPFITGPVVKPDWENIINNAHENNVQNISSSNFDMYLGLPRETITFENETKNGAFKLVYEKASGILLYGYGKYGKYELAVTIASTSVQIGISTITYALVGVPIVIVIVVVLLFILRRRK
ncbi:MAG: hypothetical protein ACP6IS_02415 [Candidatus Asgardarchaeia archaeon]